MPSVLDAGVEAAVKRMCRDHACEAAVVYGSRVFGDWDAKSDVDVVIVDADPEARMRHEIHAVDGFEIDASIAGSNVIVKQFKLRHKANSHWMLNAFSHCCVVYDLTGAGRKLQLLAEKLWNDGPRPMTREEIRAARSDLQRMIVAAERIYARPASAENTALGRMRSDHALTTAIYLYFCLRGQWTTALPRLLGRCEREYPEIFELWKSYASAGDFCAALDCVRKVADRAFAEIDY